MTQRSAYQVLIDRIPRQFREAARRLAMELVDHAMDAGFMGQVFGAPALQRAMEDWHSALAHARAWAALAGARTLHEQTTLPPRQFAAQQQATIHGKPLSVGVFFALPFDEALDAYYLRHSEILIDPTALFELYWERGASIAEAAAAEMRQKILQSLGNALEIGVTLRDWRSHMARTFGGTEPYFETVWRTNTAQAYSDGQRAQAANFPDVIGFRRLTTRDDTTRPNHRAAHGLIYGKEDPRADTLAVPWGFPPTAVARTRPLRALRPAGWASSLTTTGTRSCRTGRRTRSLTRGSSRVRDR